MRIKKEKIEQHNQQLLPVHRRKLDYINSGLKDPETLLRRLADFQVAIPSWALGTGGTRFARFSSGGEPRSLEEKISDVGLLHALNRSSGAISLHIPWDIPTDPGAIKALAADFGLRFDAMNSNTFQDQPGQEHSYKFGSLQHVRKEVRRQAIDHVIDVIRLGGELGSESLTVWLADGSCFPGQLNFQKPFNKRWKDYWKFTRPCPATGNYF